jgi:hypothetical protein
MKIHLEDNYHLPLSPKLKRVKHYITISQMNLYLKFSLLHYLLQSILFMKLLLQNHSAWKNFFRKTRSTQIHIQMQIVHAQNNINDFHYHYNSRFRERHGVHGSKLKPSLLFKTPTHLALHTRELNYSFCKRN